MKKSDRRHVLAAPGEDETGSSWHCWSPCAFRWLRLRGRGVQPVAGPRGLCFSVESPGEIGSLQVHPKHHMQKHVKGGTAVLSGTRDPHWLRDIAASFSKALVFICKMGVIILC